MSLLDVDAKSIIKRINRIIKTIEEKKYTFKTTGEILQILKDIDFAYNDNVYNFLEDTTDALSLIPKNYELSIEVNAKNKLKNDLNENEKFPSYKLTVSKGKFQNAFIIMKFPYDTFTNPAISRYNWKKKFI